MKWMHQTEKRHLFSGLTLGSWFDRLVIRSKELSEGSSSKNSMGRWIENR